MNENEYKKNSRETSILSSFSYLTLGKIFGDIFYFFLFVVLTRYFGKEGIGQYSFAMALMGFFSVFADFGLYSFTIKEVSKRKADVSDYYGLILSLRLALTLLVSCVLLITITLYPFSTDTKSILVLIGGYQLFSCLVEGFGANFVAHGDSHLAGQFSAAYRGCAALAGVTAILFGWSLVATLSTLPLTVIPFLFLAFGLTRKKYGQVQFNFFPSSLGKIFREARPYAASLVVNQVYSRIDVVLLGFFLGVVFSGIYNAAYRIIFLLIFLPHYAAMAILPIASKLFTESKNELRKLYNTTINSSLLVGVPMTGGVWLISNDLIRIIFGETLAESSEVLRVLSCVLWLICLERMMGAFLLACDLQVSRAKIHFVTAVITVISNLLLIPILGIMGAALSAIIAEVTLVTFFAFQLKKDLGLPDLALRFLASVLGTSLFVFVFVNAPAVSLFVTIPASAVLYAGSLMLFKDIRNNELKYILEKLRPITAST